MSVEDNDTLAPIRLKEYQTQNLGDKDTVLLTTLSKNLIRNIELTLSSLSSMTNDLKMYKEVMVDSIAAEAEGIDLTTKYARNENEGQPHNLPGVVSLPPVYDLTAIKSDKDRFDSVKEIRDKTNQQKQLYLKILEQDFKTFIQVYKKLVYCDNSFGVFVESLNQKTGSF